MQWEPLLPKEGGMIQVDIGGHPPIPLGSPPLFLFSFLNCSITYYFWQVFWVLNFQSHFEGLKGVFRENKETRKVPNYFANFFLASSSRYLK